MNLMDMSQMLGNFGEFFGAIAVVATLFYLAVQVRHGRDATEANTRETRAATTQATLDSEMFVQSHMLRYAGTWDKVTAGLPLSEGEEERRGILLINMLMALNENRFHQIASGYLEGHTNIEAIGDLPIFEAWRDSRGALARSQEFLDFVDSQRKQFTDQ